MTTAVIACGALAKDILILKQLNNWDIEVFGVSTLLHNRPEKIPLAVKKRINALKKEYTSIVVAYGDCGTSGLLDNVLNDTEIKRLSGPHCFEMYAGSLYESVMEENPGTYWLTDYLVQSFDHLVIEGLGLDKHPELVDEYFKHYKQVIYLANSSDSQLMERAKDAAQYLGLPLKIIINNFGDFSKRMEELLFSDQPKSPPIKQRSARIEQSNV